MNKKIFFTCLFIVVSMIVGGPFIWMRRKSQRKNQPLALVPNTVSNLAQEFIKNNHPFEVRPKSLREWSEFRNSFTTAMKESGKKAYDEFIESAVVRKMANVEVLEITPKNFDKKK